MKFSICIPNYNYEKYLGRTIQSVLDQTDADFEIVVSDNASTDRFAGDRARLQRSANSPAHERLQRRLRGQSRSRRPHGERRSDADALVGRFAARPARWRCIERFSRRSARPAKAPSASAAVDVIDADDRTIGRVGLPANDVWRRAIACRSSTRLPVGPVYRVAGARIAPPLSAGNAESVSVRRDDVSPIAVRSGRRLWRRATDESRQMVSLEAACRAPRRPILSIGRCRLTAGTRRTKRPSNLAAAR